MHTANTFLQTFEPCVNVHARRCVNVCNTVQKNVRATAESVYTPRRTHGSCYNPQKSSCHLCETPERKKFAYVQVHVRHCSKVDFPFCCFMCLFMTSFHSMSTAAFASGINVAWGGRFFAHALGFPWLASLRDRPPESSELGSPRLAEQNNIRSLYSFLPTSTLEYSVLPGLSGLLEEFCPTDTPCRETRQHALAFTFEKN